MEDSQGIRADERRLDSRRHGLNRSKERLTQRSRRFEGSDLLGSALSGSIYWASASSG